ncbi:winged helix-turn-helix domain-containing protein, partial [Planctomycetota bacterium]
MLGTVAATCRALACDAKLVILHHLSHKHELQSSEIAQHASLGQDIASHHLVQLATLGLLLRRCSGPRVLYRLDANPTGPGPAVVAALVRRACLHVTWATAAWRRSRLL